MGDPIGGIASLANPNAAGNSQKYSTVTSDLSKYYNQYLPLITQTTSQQQSGVEQQQYNASAGVSPQYSQLGLSQAQQYALPYAQVGQDVQRSNVLAGAGTNLAQIQGAGGDAARSAANLEYQLSPGYRGANQLVNSINLNGLSPGEYNSAERALNQSNASTGNLGNINAMNTINNALNFGGAFNQKQQLMNNAIQSANGTGFSPTSVALGQPSSQASSNLGTSYFNPVTQAGNQSYQLGSDWMNALSGNKQTQQGLAWDSTNANSFNAKASQFGPNCCFIFMEAYNGKLPWFVRECRDMFYKANPDLGVGYERMAKWLVPLMRRSSIIRNTINKHMIIPLTRFGGYLCHVKGCEDGWKYKRHTSFWFNVWNIYGKI